jgi:ureidoacrylate peracid hydrolase
VTGPSREVAIDLDHAALLVIDVQNYCLPRKEDPEFYAKSLRGIVLPNLKRLIGACRGARIEVLYSVMENMTRDGRDRSLDYVISGIDVAKGSWEARVIEEVAPGEDEMIFRKTSSDVFASTNIDYVLRNLGVRSLIVAGLLTEQCVESAVRSACDRGYLVTLVPDAATSRSPERHEHALPALSGYCRQRRTDELVAEIAALSAKRGAVRQ